MDAARKVLVGEVLEAIVAAGRPLMTERRHPFGDVMITPTQMHALFVLAHHARPVTVGDLSTELGVTPGAVTQLVDTLCTRGLVTREDNPDDARSKHVRLTDAAARSVSEFESAAIARSQWRFADLADDELENLAALLRRVRVHA